MKERWKIDEREMKERWKRWKKEGQQEKITEVYNDECIEYMH